MAETGFLKTWLEDEKPPYNLQGEICILTCGFKLTLVWVYQNMRCQPLWQFWPTKSYDILNTTKFLGAFVTVMYFYKSKHQNLHWAKTKYQPWHDKTNKVSVRPAKTQISLGIRPVWSVFPVRMKKPWVLTYPLSTQRRLWSDWKDETQVWWRSIQTRVTITDVCNQVRLKQAFSPTEACNFWINRLSR